MFVALMDGSEEDLVLYIDELINKARFGDLIFFACLFFGKIAGQLRSTESQICMIQQVEEAKSSSEN